jgi:hypothetical protein
LAGEAFAFWQTKCTQPPLKLLVNEFTRVTCQAPLRVVQTRRS